MPIRKPSARKPALPIKVKPIFSRARYKSLRGGRGSGKSHSLAQLSVLRMANLVPDYQDGGAVRICSARQFQKQISESVKTAIEYYIKMLGFSKEFIVTKYEINHVNGSHMWFPGFMRNPESLLSVEDVDVLWIEQAESIGDEMEIIIPTIRKDDSEVWLSWNPSSRAQWCWNRFVLNPRPGDISIEMNYTDNPWFPKVLDDERLAFQIEEPDRYEHVYLGKPDDGDASRQVLPYSVIQKCVQAWKENPELIARLRKEAWPIDAGLDMAEGGKNKCGLVIRQGPLITLLKLWPGVAGDLSNAAAVANETVEDTGVMHLYYDASSPMKSEFRRLGVRYITRPVGFGGKVGGPDALYESRRPNSLVFKSRNIQMADAIRLRANRTVRWLGGDKSIDPLKCLFINPEISRMEHFLSELTQPVRRESPVTGKWELDKRGASGNEESPDSFDALCLAFARDSAKGLRAR